MTNSVAPEGKALKSANRERERSRRRFRIPMAAMADHRAAEEYRVFARFAAEALRKIRHSVPPVDVDLFEASSLG